MVPQKDIYICIYIYIYTHICVFAMLTDICGIFCLFAINIYVYICYIDWKKASQSPLVLIKMWIAILKVYFMFRHLILLVPNPGTKNIPVNMHIICIYMYQSHLILFALLLYFTKPPWYPRVGPKFSQLGPPAAGVSDRGLPVEVSTSRASSCSCGYSTHVKKPSISEKKEHWQETPNTVGVGSQCARYKQK